MIERLEKRVAELKHDLNQRLKAKNQLVNQLTALENGIKEKNGALIEVTSLLEQAKRAAATPQPKPSPVKKKVTKKK